MWSGPDLSTAGQLVLGRYRLLAKLGQGGMGDVYLAASDGFGGLSKLVVIKRLRNIEDPHHVAMFINEARIARQLSHPNIVQTYELGEEGGKYLIVMEYLHGPTQARLRRAAAGQGGTPWAIELEVMRNVLEGLHYAHELAGPDGQKLRLVHRDLSPENVIVTELGECKILDFGIAKAADSVVQTQAGFFKGKLKSMPPEQFRGEPVDRRSDIFAAGVMLWEGLTGLSFWGDLNAAAISAQLAQGKIPNLAELAPDLPVELRTLCEGALDPSPAGRYENALVMRAAVVDYIQRNGLLVTRAQLAAFVDPLFREERDNIDRMIRSQLEHHDLRFSVPMGATVPLERPTEVSGRSATRPLPAPAPEARPRGMSAFTILLIVAVVLAGSTWAWHRLTDRPSVALAPEPQAPVAKTEPTPAPSGPSLEAEETARRYLAAGEELMASGAYGAAAAILTKLEVLSVTDPALVERMAALRDGLVLGPLLDDARAHLGAERWDQAIASAQRALAYRSANAEALAIVARAEEAKSASATARAPQRKTEAEPQVVADPGPRAGRAPSSEGAEDEPRRRRTGPRLAIRERQPAGKVRREARNQDVDDEVPPAPAVSASPSPPSRATAAPPAEEPGSPSISPAEPPAAKAEAPVAATPAAAPPSAAVPSKPTARGPVVSARPVSDLPIPDLPRAFQPSSRAQLMKMCALVEAAVVSLAGVSPAYARDVTAPFREAVREDSEIYPIGMYFFIIREAGLGHERAAAAAALAAAQRNGLIKRFKDLPERAR